MRSCGSGAAWVSDRTGSCHPVHHVAYQVEDVTHALEQAREAGLRLIDETPRTGIRGTQVAFLHPATAGGVLTELVQPVEAH